MWVNHQKQGPLGYLPNTNRTWLIVKPEHLQRAKEMFPDFNITADDHKYLCSFIGNAEEVVKYVEKQIEEWSKCPSYNCRV